MRRGLAAAAIAFGLVAAFTASPSTDATAATSTTSSAAGEQLSGQQVRALAAQAEEDPAALARLRNVDRVDGRATDLRTLLSGTSQEVATRLRSLAGEGTAPPAGAPGQARAILASRDFHRHDLPRPLRGPLRWLADRARPVTGPIGRLIDRLDLNSWMGAGLGAVVILLAAIFGLRLAHRRALAIVGDADRVRTGGARETPDGLERQADRAESAGDHETALRLRFRAGLLRLDAVGALRYRPWLTTGAVTRQVASPTLVHLAATVDAVVYGGRPASTQDVEEARRRWPTVLAEARPR